ncbi:NAD(P)-binding protein [Viridothelium virens]|uniref:NAD(P)-binding protein n=1 Tax=Viridothelium virens TaxID=1048519 RepID=A0A6A6GVS0_VIRVR|nr:NAD(P)-binding protein [Viridothelium virens]
MPSNPDSDLILVTCASGKQASPLLPLLAKRYKRLRLAVGSKTSQERIKSLYPHADVVQTDLADPQSMRELFRGVTACYYVGPSFHHHETQCGYHAIDAAVKETKEGNFKHFVYSSVLNSQFRKLLNHDCKRYVEEYLYESGTLQHLNYTVLKPCNFIDMFPIQMIAEQAQPVYPAPWDPNVANSLICLDDLAAVGVKVLDEREAHFFAEYPLCSTMPVPYTEMAAAAGRALGKEVRIELAPFEDRVKRLSQIVLGPDPNPRAVDGSERLILWYERHGLCGSPKVLEMLLGRKAITVDEWMVKGVQKARASKA